MPYSKLLYCKNLRRYEEKKTESRKQFEIRHWKANGQTNVMTILKIKIEPLKQPEKSRNMFERIQNMKNSRAIVFDFPFSFRHIFTSFCSRIIWNTALES